MILVGIGYCLGSCLKEESSKKEAKARVSESLAKQPAQTKKQTHRKRNIPEEKPKKHIVIQSRTASKDSSASKEAVVTHTVSHSKLAYRGDMPKLAIIIDDVHTLAQLRAIASIGFPVTPSIFPPFSLSPNTPKLATQAVHYMIHLPMESGNAKFDAQSKTIMRSFDSEKMRKRMHELRRLFPRARYMNNHTGSKFTSDEKAMRRAYEALRRENFAFIDSRTTAKSKVGKIAHDYGDDYVARDIFIDNKKEVGYIHRQLQKAVSLAKRNGYAIAIGHPHRVTIEALKRAKRLLKEVEVVYIDDIFRE